MFLSSLRQSALTKHKKQQPWLKNYKDLVLLRSLKVRYELRYKLDLKKQAVEAKYFIN